MKKKLIILFAVIIVLLAMWIAYMLLLHYSNVKAFTIVISPLPRSSISYGVP